MKLASFLTHAAAVLLMGAAADPLHAALALGQEQEQEPGQESQEPKPEPVTVSEAIRELRVHLADRGRQDREAREVIDKLAGAFETLEPRDQLQVVRGIGQVFAFQREPGASEIYVTACEALSRMGTAGARELMRALDLRHFRNDGDWQPFRAQGVVILGRMAEPHAVPWLKKLFRERFDLIIAAAGRALGHYEKAPEAIRKDIVQEMVRTLNSIYNQARATVDPHDLQQRTFVERYNTIQDAWHESLARLTGQSFREPPEWERWFAHNRRLPWPDRSAEKGGGAEGDAGGDGRRQGD